MPRVASMSSSQASSSTRSSSHPTHSRSRNASGIEAPIPIDGDLRWLCPYCLTSITSKLCTGSKKAANADRPYVLCFARHCSYSGTPDKKYYFFWLDLLPKAAIQPASSGLSNAALPSSVYPPNAPHATAHDASFPCTYIGCTTARGANRACRRCMCAKHCRASGGCVGVKAHEGADPIASWSVSPATPSLPSQQAQAPRLLVPQTMVAARYITPPPLATRSRSPSRSSSPAIQTRLWLYHQDGFPVECLDVDIAGTLPLSDIHPLTQFLNLCFEAEQFNAATSVVKIYNILQQKWETININLAIDVSSQAYDPLIVSLRRCTEHPKLDAIIHEALT